jgi:hypothetical protein
MAITGDFNGDGRADVLSMTHSNSGDNFLVRLSNGNGTVQPARAFSVDRFSSLIGVADFNHDGKLNIATWSLSTYAISVFLGNGDGSFKPPVKSPLGATRPQALAVGDFDNDGRLEIVVSGFVQTGRSGYWGIDSLSGNGDGSFHADSPFPSHYATSLVVGDFNGDHHLDVLGTDGSSVFLLLGTGQGAFSAPTSIASVAAGVLVAGDLNGDGKLDFAAFGASNTLSVFLGNGNGTFHAPRNTLVVAGTYALAAADFNHDGKLDLVTVNPTGGTVSLLLNKGDGAFQPAQTFTVGPDQSFAAAADFNGDGYRDLVVDTFDSATQTSSFSVMLNDRHW